MASAGVEAILIKVAAMGLTSRHLGKTIGQMYPSLCIMVNAPYQCIVAISFSNMPVNFRMNVMTYTFAEKVESTKHLLLTAHCSKSVS
jgi:hypothetical protein